MVRALVASVLAIAACVVAQDTSAVCGAGFSWMFNSLNQSPCVVGSYLEGACADTVFTIGALPSGRHYVGPSAPSLATPCICSSVAYSLVSACAFCQNATEVQKWSAWITNCSSSEVTAHGYPRPVPSGTAIPFWAFQVVTVGDIFDLPTAFNDSQLHNADVPAGTSVGGAKKKSSIGAIAGGAAGGGVLLVLVVGLAVICCIRTRRRRARAEAISEPASQPFIMAQAPATPAPGPYGYPQTPPPGSFGYPQTPPPPGAQYAYPPPPLTPKLYDPNDPSTFPQEHYTGNTAPPPFGPSPVYTSYGGSGNGHYGQPGAYSGVPEI